MKKAVMCLFCLTVSIVFVCAQSPVDLLKKVTSSKSNGDSLSTGDVVSGLKEALNTGVTKGTGKLSAVDGFFKDAALKILLPPEAQKVDKTLRSLGFGREVDDAILAMNRAAEDAVKSAAPIFLSAIKQMSIGDAWGILKGGDTAATKYLREKTSTSLTQAFKPVIDKSLEKTGATRYWNTAFTSYNQFSLKKINPDLSSYVTDKALTGIFYEVALEEAQIRKDPLAQTSDLLKKVFGK